MNKISKSELLTILATVGVSSSSVLAANNLHSNSSDLNPLAKSEHTRPAYLADESKCGKGSCGKDEKGAAAAKEKHSKTKDASSKTNSKKKSAKN